MSRLSWLVELGILLCIELRTVGEERMCGTKVDTVKLSDCDQITHLSHNIAITLPASPASSQYLKHFCSDLNLTN